MSQHTPGPWYLSGHNIFARYSDNGGNVHDRWVGTVSAGQGDTPRMVDYANARLIAAAPELLALVEEFMRHCNADSTVGWPLADRARTAIAKAKGE